MKSPEELRQAAEQKEFQWQSNEITALREKQRILKTQFMRLNPAAANEENGRKLQREIYMQGQEIKRREEKLKNTFPHLHRGPGGGGPTVFQAPSDSSRNCEFFNLSDIQ